MRPFEYLRRCESCRWGLHRSSTGQGFNFNQDVVLKSGLVLGGIKDIGFKVKNFTADNMAILDREWDGISESLKLAAGLRSDFGLSGATLSAASVLIPIAYYVHRRGLTQSYRTSVAHAADRDALRAWTLRSLIVQGVWGSGLDSLLRDISRAIDDHADTGFPVSEIERRMAARGRSLVVTREQVEDILTSRYGKPRTFAVLATVFSYVNTRNVHHVDHVFPRALLTRTRLKQAGFDNDAIDDIQGKLDQLANLQLLEGSVNISKSDTSPDKWASATFMTPDSYQAYLERNCIPWMPKDVNGFDAFFTARRDALSKRIMAILGDSTTPPSGAAYVSTIVSIDEELAETG